MPHFQGHHGSRGRYIGGGGGIGPGSLPPAPGGAPRRKRKKKKSGSVRSRSQRAPSPRRERRLTASSMGTRQAASLRSAALASDLSGGIKRPASAHSHQKQMVEYASPGSGQVNDSTRRKVLDYGDGGLERQLALHAPPQVQQQGGFAEDPEQPQEYDYGADAQALAGAGINIRNPPREPVEAMGGQPAVRVPVTAADTTAQPLALEAPPVDERQMVRYDDPTAEPEIEVVNRDTDSVHQQGADMLEKTEQLMIKHNIPATPENFDIDTTIGTTAHQHANAGDVPHADERYNQRTLQAAENQPEAFAGHIGDPPLQPDQPLPAFGDPAEFEVKARKAAGAGRQGEFKRGLVTREQMDQRYDARAGVRKALREEQMQKRREIDRTPKTDNMDMHGTLPGEQKQFPMAGGTMQIRQDVPPDPRAAAKPKFPMPGGTMQIRQDVPMDPRAAAKPKFPMPGGVMRIRQPTTSIPAGKPAGLPRARYTDPARAALLAEGEAGLAKKIRDDAAEAQKKEAEKARRAQQAQVVAAMGRAAQGGTGAPTGGTGTPLVPPAGMPTLQPVNQPSSALLPHGTGGTAVPAIGGVPAVQTGGTHQPISAAMQAARSQVSFNQDVRRMHARNPSISLAQAAAQLNASLGTNWPTPAPLPSGAAVGGAVSATPAIGGGGGGGGGGTAPPVPAPPALPGGGALALAARQPGTPTSDATES